MSRTYWIVSSLLWTLLIFRLTTTPQMVVTQDTWLQHILMNGAHFAFFGVQAALLYRSLDKMMVIPVVLTSVYGALIEYIQLSVPGRSADPVDWLLDTAGAIVFVYFVRKLIYHKSRIIKL